MQQSRTDIEIMTVLHDAGGEMPLQDIVNILRGRHSSRWIYERVSSLAARGTVQKVEMEKKILVRLMEDERNE